jgi:two-component system cell cycle sensor histidine kinase PleC
MTAGGAFTDNLPEYGLLHRGVAARAGEAGKRQRKTVPLLQRVHSSTVETSPGHDRDAAASAASPAAQEGTRRTSVRARVLAQQVEVLDSDFLGAAANIPAVMITAYVIRSSIPAPWLYLWIAVTIATIAVLLVAIRGPRPWRVDHARPKGTLQKRLATHIFFTTAVGAVWGGACLAFSPSLAHGQMMFLAVIVMGCNAACISALGAYLPAFFGYFASSLFPLAYVNFVRPEPDANDLALLVLLYMVTITINVRSYNRHVLAAFRLRAENEALAENVSSANAATAAAMRSKWNTLAHLSHELRTPMNAILGFSEMMREQLFGPLGERYLTYSGNIHDSGRHTLDLIDAILEVSRAEAGQLSLSESEITPPVLVAECLRMVEIVAAKKNVTLDSRFERPMPWITVDRAKLRQALLNLLTNAIKYTPEGGRVSVAVQMVDGGLDIAVADTGVGIAAGDLERCLEPFVRLSNPLTTGVEGAGLGLPLAKRLIEVHGGSLHIASELGRGTVATLHLPAERCAMAELRNAG